MKKKQTYKVTKHYFSGKDKKEYHLCGEWPVEGVIEAYLDDVWVPLKWVRRQRISLFEKQEKRDVIQSFKGTLALELPVNLDKFCDLCVYVTKQRMQNLITTIRVSELNENRRLQYHIDNTKMIHDKSVCIISGWVACDDEVSIVVKDLDGTVLKSEISYRERKDVKTMSEYASYAVVIGYIIQVDCIGVKKVSITFEGDKEKKEELIPLTKVDKYVHKVSKYAEHVAKRLPLGLGETRFEIKRTRMRCADDLPLLSVFITNADLREAAEQAAAGLEKQSYLNKEVLIPETCSMDSIKSMLEKARGAYIVFWNTEDILGEHALFELAFAAKYNKNPDIIYGDEVNPVFGGPSFKPDFSLELLRSENYIGRFFAVRKELIEKIGALDYRLGSGKEYDYLLRCVEQTNAICHISEILSQVPEKKMEVSEADKCILQNHYDRIQAPVIVENGLTQGVYHGKYEWDEEPLISIIIPNKDHIDDLKRCIDSIEEKSCYRNYEYIIVENNSTQEETFRYYERLKKENSKVSVVVWNGVFNYSAINNFGTKYANGEYYLLLNNDTSIINEACLKELVDYCMQENVGAVGARLFYDDDTIQHAGVIVGHGGIAGHAFSHKEKSCSGYMNRIVCVQEYSAVTAACLLVKKSVYEEVGGLNEDFAVAFNDIDFCLKIRDAGYRIIYNPYAELYHYESKSRGSEDTPEKVARFQGEIRLFEDTWQDILIDGDPYYNRNLTIDHEAFLQKR